MSWCMIRMGPLIRSSSLLNKLVRWLSRLRLRRLKRSRRRSKPKGSSNRMLIARIN